jgi:hypothetical protein
LDAFFSQLCVAPLASATLVAAPQEELAPGAALPALTDHQRVAHLTVALGAGGTARQGQLVANTDVTGVGETTAGINHRW